MSGDDVTIERWSLEQVAAESAAIQEVFVGAFAMSDDAAARFVATLATHATRPAFRFVAARDVDSRLLGFIYEYTGAPGQPFHDLLRRTLDPATIARWLEAPFEVVEFGVRPEAQGRGIGGRLHDALLAELANRTAVLSTRQGDTTAMRLYRGRGWQTIRADYRFPGNDHPYVIMGRDRPGEGAGRL